MPHKTLLLGLDGLPASLFNSLYDGGQLPHFRETFGRGLRMRRVATAFPTDSKTCMPLIFQGCRVADLDPIAQLFYDRSKKHFNFAWDFLPFSHSRNRRPPVPSILRSAPRTLVIGISEASDAGAYIPPFYTLLGSFLTPLAPRFDSLVFRAIPRLLARYDTVAYWSVSSDHVGHTYGREAMSAALCRFDEKFGALVAALPSEVIVLLISDHGNQPVEIAFDPARILRQLGYRLVRDPSGERDVVMCDSLLNYAFLYTPGNPARLAESLRPRPEIGLCAFRGPGEAVTVTNRQGQAEIRTRDGRFRYTPLEGDPLGYGLTRPLEISARDWLSRSIESRYPYAVVRLWQVFQNPQCGDLALSFDNGYYPEWTITLGGRVKARLPMLKFRQNHGGMEREQVLTVFLGRGPGIPAETRDHALIEDVYSILRRQFV
ncbi:MAG: alkaline phosphatase family protein [Chloroflexi bacterium]|nr:alkaline phosphatase family protein [Chloroflexota bacterium]